MLFSVFIQHLSDLSICSTVGLSDFLLSCELFKFSKHSSLYAVCSLMLWKCLLHEWFVITWAFQRSCCIISPRVSCPLLVVIFTSSLTYCDVHWHGEGGLVLLFLWSHLFVKSDLHLVPLVHFLHLSYSQAWIKWWSCNVPHIVYTTLSRAKKYRSICYYSKSNMCELWLFSTIVHF